MEDLDGICALAADAIAYMEGQGILQWDELYPSREVFQKDIEADNLFIGYDKCESDSLHDKDCYAVSAAEPAVIYVLNQEFDEEYKNGKWADGTKSFYVIHRLCVNPKYQNRGIAQMTMAHIEKTLQAKGIESVRLDVFTKNPFALKLYDRCGYHNVGKVHWRKGDFYLMEKDITIAARTLLLFDLDGTLLRTDKTISPETLKAINRCREKGYFIGISTARSEGNSERFLQEINPDLIIASGGAIVRFQGNIIYEAGFTKEETMKIIDTALYIGNEHREITVDTLNAHYWNYTVPPARQDASWGETIYTDYKGFDCAALKICVELPAVCYAEEIAASVQECHWVPFSDGDWYKFSKAQATKEAALTEILQKTDFSLENIIAFGDDYADIGMLKMCGKGIAMGNAIDAVKEIADEVVDSNDSDGIAKWVYKNILNGTMR